MVRVNIGLDAPPYGVGEPVDEPASLTALVNKYHPLPADYVPELELLPPGYTASQGARLRPEACAAFLQMAQCFAANVRLGNLVDIQGALDTGFNTGVSQCILKCHCVHAY